MMNDEERIDETIYAEVLEDVAKAKERCRKFVENDEDQSLTSKQREFAAHKLGGNEGRCIAMILASLDTDGDGTITHSELDEFETVAREYRTAASTQLMNVAIVAALVMSFVVPTIISVLEIAPKSAAFFEGAIDYLEVIHHALALFTLAIAALTIFVALRITSQLEWIMTSYGKLKFLTSGLAGTEINIPQLMATSQMWMLNSLQCFILVRVSICCSPVAGLISMILSICVYTQLTLYICGKLLSKSADGIAKKEIGVLIRKMANTSSTGTGPER